MPRRSITIALASIALGATLALAEPQFVLRYPGGVPQVSITGDFSGSTYTVWRTPASGGDAVRVTDGSVLCLGACYAEDRSAAPGSSYFYVFEVTSPGSLGAAPLSFGPYLATISPALARPVGVFAFPNPGQGPTQVQLYVSGARGDAAVQGHAAVYDPAGRLVRSLLRGPMPPGITNLSWDGRDDRGAMLRPGVYLLRFAAEGRAATARLLRR